MKEDICESVCLHAQCKTSHAADCHCLSAKGHWSQRTLNMPFQGICKGKNEPEQNFKLVDSQDSYF